MSAWLKNNMVSWETKFLQTGEVSAQSDALQSYDLIVLTRAYIILPFISFGSEFSRPLCKGKEFLCFANLPYLTKVGWGDLCIGHITLQKDIRLKSRK